MILPRRTFLAGTAAALPRVAIAQTDQRPSLTIAVQKIANSGTLEPLREQSSNASEHYLAAMLETPIARNQQHWLERQPGLAESWRRIDDKTVELTLRANVRYHDGSTLTADDVAWNFGPERMFGAALPADIPPVARRHWPALARVEATGPLTVRFVNETPDITMEGRLSAGGSEIVNPRSFKTPWIDYARAPSGTGPYKLREFRPDVSLTLDAHDDYWGGRPPFKSLRFLEIGEAARARQRPALRRIRPGLRHPARPDPGHRGHRQAPCPRRARPQPPHRQLRHASPGPGRPPRAPRHGPRRRRPRPRRRALGRPHPGAPGPAIPLLRPHAGRKLVRPRHRPGHRPRPPQAGRLQGRPDPLPHPQQLLRRRDRHRPGAGRHVGGRRPQRRDRGPRELVRRAGQIAPARPARLVQQRPSSTTRSPPSSTRRARTAPSRPSASGPTPR